VELVAVDIGGTHARFAIAEIADGRVAALGDFLTLKTADYASLQPAWQAFGKTCARPLPRAAAFAVASAASSLCLASGSAPVA
jgi:glucokinase